MTRVTRASLLSASLAAGFFLLPAQSAHAIPLKPHLSAAAVDTSSGTPQGNGNGSGKADGTNQGNGADKTVAHDNRKSTRAMQNSTVTLTPPTTADPGTAGGNSGSGTTTTTTNTTTTTSNDTGSSKSSNPGNGKGAAIGNKHVQTPLPPQASPKATPPAKSTTVVKPTKKPAKAAAAARKPATVANQPAQFSPVDYFGSYVPVSGEAAAGQKPVTAKPKPKPLPLTVAKKDEPSNPIAEAVGVVGHLVGGSLGGAGLPAAMLAAFILVFGMGLAVGATRRTVTR